MILSANRQCGVICRAERAEDFDFIAQRFVGWVSPRAKLHVNPTRVPRCSPPKSLRSSDAFTLALWQQPAMDDERS